MSRKRQRDERAAADMTIVNSEIHGHPTEEGGEPDYRVYVHRSRKARRAQARLDKLNWRKMLPGERLQQ